MYEPETSVSMPEIDPADRRGLTTQKRAWSVMILDAVLSICILTMTWLMSDARLMSSTVPSVTALCFTSV